MPGVMTDRTERAWSRGLHGLGFVATLAASAGLAAMLYFPLRMQEESLDANLGAAWRLLHDSDAISDQHAAARATLAAAEERIRTLREQIPGTAEEAKFLAQLGGLADETKFRILDYRPGSPEPHDFCRQIRVQLRGRGDYESLCRFLAGLDTLPRLCRATGLAIDSARAEADGYDVEMTLTIYFGVRQDALDAAAGERHG